MTYQMKDVDVLKPQIPTVALRTQFTTGNHNVEPDPTVKNKRTIYNVVNPIRNLQF